MKIELHLSTLSRRAKTSLLLLSLIGLTGGAQAAASEKSPSELLEQGIYSEETKGDVDAAMKLYQQVVAEAKTGQSLAAQAQYRLGVCHYKKKNYAEATAAFEKLVKDYPDQKELVTRATEYLAGAVMLQPVPWVDGEELRFEVKFPSGMKIGTASYGVSASELDGRKIWRLKSHLFAGVQQLSRAEVEADSFKPIHSRWKHSLIGDADTVYSPGQARVKMKGKDEVETVELEGVVYDNEEAIQLMRRFPLAAGYSTSVRVFTGLGGGAIIPLKIEVTGPEPVTVTAGTFNCYKVELSLKQTFWYSADDHRYLVKFEGGGVVAELAGIHQRKAGEPATYRDAAFNISLTAPADWIFDRSDKSDATKLAVLLLDPEGSALTRLNVQSRESLKAEARKSVRDWAEADVAEAGKSLKDFNIRAGSWKELTVGGHPSVSVVADFVDGQEKKIAYGVFVFAAPNALKFISFAGANDFAEFQPGLDAVINSFKAN